MCVAYYFNFSTIMDIGKLFLGYGLTTIVFFLIDFIWLGTVAKSFYFKHIGDLLLQPFNVPAAVGFYLVYIIGIFIFAIMPSYEAGSAVKALFYGALFGFFAYATYDMTNLATLKGWSVIVVIVDIIWGTVLTGSVALAGYYILRMIGYSS